MALADLPPELLEQIIQHTLPEGFESLALSCKDIYMLCKPFIEHHNHLRFLFQDFNYSDIPVPSTIRTAVDLLERIAAEPVVARYIRTANFGYDSFDWVIYDQWPEDKFARLLDDMTGLLTTSPYIAQVGLDPKEYCAEIEKDITNTDRKGIRNSSRAARYSQRAAAFLLTLLPNVEEVKFPQMWRAVDDTDKLIDVAISEAKEPPRPGYSPGLGLVTGMGGSSFIWKLSMRWVTAFFALPQMQYFHCRCWIATEDDRASLVPRYLQPGLGKSLAQVRLGACCIDEVIIGEFLKQTPRLKIFGYSHWIDGGGPLEWNICAFITAVERAVGHHLEQFWIAVCEPRGLFARQRRTTLLPGWTSMRGFQHLQKLTFPLDVVMCIIDATKSQTATPNESQMVEELADLSLDHAPSIGNLVPESVSQLTLISRRVDHHDRALDLLFDDLASQRQQLPALAELNVWCPYKTAEATYKARCREISAEVGKTGIDVDVVEWPSLLY